MIIPIPMSSSNVNVKVVNKNIVYKDTVLSFRKLGKNIKITTISDVEEYLLEKCLEKILESNPGVIFNTIQYSKNDKKVYFYTNESISTKAWDDRNVMIYEPLTNVSSILEEIKMLLLSEENFDANCVSLYDVAQLLKQTKESYKKTEENYDNYFGTKIKSIYGEDSGLVIYGFDYDNNEFKMGIRFERKLYDYKKIVFSKKKNDLYIKQDSTNCGQEILLRLGNDISKCYDELISFRDFRKQKKYGIQAVNSNFFVGISHYGVSISEQLDLFFSEFKLDSLSRSDKYSYNCNSNSILDVLRGKEDEVFKKIFVNINDCPSWMRDKLYEVRKNQLEEEQKLFEQKRLEESNRQTEENKKGKKLIRKMFSFLKK